MLDRKIELHQFQRYARQSVSILESSILSAEGGLGAKLDWVANFLQHQQAAANAAGAGANERQQAGGAAGACAQQQPRRRCQFFERGNYELGRDRPLAHERPPETVGQAIGMLDRALVDKALELKSSVIGLARDPRPAASALRGAGGGVVPSAHCPAPAAAGSWRLVLWIR